jgi:hypothetical protein
MNVSMKAVSSPSLTSRIAAYDVNGNQLNIANATAGGSVSLTASVTAGRTYYVVMSGAGTTGSYQANISIATTSGVVPRAPSDLKATAISSSQINLTWENNSTNQTGFDVYGSTNGTTFVLWGPVTPGAATSYSRTGLAAGTKYWFKIMAVDLTGASAASNVVSVTTMAATPVVPAAPSGLTATAVSPSQINLTWTNNSTSQTSFNVYGSTNGTTFTLRGPVTPGTATSYSGTSLAAGTKYWFKITAVDSAGASAASNVVSATTLAATPTVPAAPTGLTATIATQTQINLAWAPEASTQTGFNVYESTDGTNFSQLATVSSASAASYSVTGLTAGTQYWFKVTALDTTGESAASSVANATTPAATVAAQPGTYSESVSGDLGGSLNAATPITLSSSGTEVITGAIAGSTDEDAVTFTAPMTGTMTVSMQAANSPTITGRVAAYDVNGNLLNIANAPAGGSASLTTSVTAGSTYFVVISARGTTGSYQANISIAAAAAPTVPTVPTGLTATAASQTEIDLAWAAESSTQTGFNVYEATNGTNFSLLSAVNTAGATSYAATGLTAGTQYWFKVTALGTAGESAASNVANATTLAATLTVPAAPSGLTATAVSQSQINLTWTNSSTSQTSFNVYGSTDGTTFVLWGPVTPGTATSYSGTGLAAGTQYWFKVTAVDAASESAASNVATATTVAATQTPPPATGMIQPGVPSIAPTPIPTTGQVPGNDTYINFGNGYGVNAPNGPAVDPSDPSITTWAQCVAKYGSDLAFLHHLGYAGTTVLYNDDNTAALQPGDIDLFTTQEMDGNYAFGASNIHGTAGNPITIMAEPGSVVTIAASVDGANFTNDSYVIVSGFTFNGKNCSGGDGIDLYTSTNMTFMDINEFGYGLGLRGMQGLSNIDIYDCVFADNTSSHGMYIGARDLPNANIFVHNSIFYGNQNQAFQQNGRCNNLEFYDNIVHSNINAGVSLLEGNSNAIIADNLIYDNGAEGIVFYDYDDSNTGGIFPYNQLNNVVENNIVWEGKYDMSGGTNAALQPDILIVDSTAAGNYQIQVAIKNNILVSYDGPAVTIDNTDNAPLTTITGNTIYSQSGTGMIIAGTSYSFSAMQAYGSNFAGNTFANPNFVSANISNWATASLFNFAIA